jgi:hypothetical protein
MARLDRSLPATPELAHDLRQINELIIALRAASAHEDDDLDDMRWLQERRRFILSVIAARDLQKQQRVVSLAAWRSGRLLGGESQSRVA